VQFLRSTPSTNEGDNVIVSAHGGGCAALEPSQSAVTFSSNSFVLTPSETMNLEIGIERTLIQERITRQRIEGTAHRTVADILEQMLKERQRELQDLLPSGPAGKSNDGRAVAPHRVGTRVKRKLFSGLPEF
jgi:hypothetical protein